MKALNRGYYVTAALAIGFFVATRWLLSQPRGARRLVELLPLRVIGVLTSVAFVYITQYYTEYRYRPVQEIADASQTGPGDEHHRGHRGRAWSPTVLPGSRSSSRSISRVLPRTHCGRERGRGGGLFGTAVATMGMLGTAAYILAMDTFGPITDNAGGIVEMSRAARGGPRSGPTASTRSATRRRRSRRATPSARPRSRPSCSSPPTSTRCELLLAAVRRVPVNLAKPEVFVGGLLGAMLVFLFCSLAIRAVGKAAQSDHQGGPRAVQPREPGHHGRARRSRTTAVRRHRDRRRAEADGAPGVLVVVMPIAVGLVFTRLYYAVGNRPRSRGRGRLPDGRHHRRHPDGDCS